MQKLKIGLVFDDTLDKPDGVQQYILTVGTWLQRQGHNVHYIVGETMRRDVPGTHSMGRNVKVRFNQNRMSIPLPVPKAKIRALLAQEKFDVLHVQVPYSPQLSARVIAAAPKTTAVIGTFHIAPHSRLVHAANQLLGVWLKPTLKRFDTMLAVSRVAQTFARQTFDMSSDVLPNTIDLTPFFVAKPLLKYKDGPTVVFLGRLVERKGCQYLLRAVAELKKTHTQPFRVVVCGGGPLEKALRAYVAQHGLQDTVSFEGYIAEADKPQYLASADIVTYPSTGGESFGIVILEAMAAARGVVLAGNNPGYASVLESHPKALFDPRNTQSFAALLKQYLEDPKARKTARDWQRVFVKQFDISVVGPKILEVYEQALRKRQDV
ncbi:MAG TPA: glycosyltransferase family 4 protein [Candidatus Saccharimonadales bacterium]|nr:glycosyltransferase family 4 protein [Candidatus Saccharimonadales bacterium]